MIGLVQIIQRLLYCKFQQDFLPFLKKKSIKLPTPKNLYFSKVCINLEMTIFAASKWEIVYVEKNNKGMRRRQIVDVCGFMAHCL